MLDIRKRGLLTNGWSVVPGGDAPADIRAAKLCDKWLAGIDAETLFNNMLDSTLYGLSVIELIWATDGGHWLPREARSKPPWRFVFDTQFRLRVLTWADTYYGDPTLPAKFLVTVRERSNDNPYGKGLGIRLYWAQLFRRYCMQFWARYGDRFGTPYVVGTYPGTAKQSERTLFRRMLASLRRDTALMKQEGFQVEFANAGSGGSAQTDFYKNWKMAIDEDIAVCVLGNTLTTTMSGSSGSRAAGEVHERVSQAAMTEDAHRIQTALRRQAFKWITHYNIDDNAKVPMLHFDMPALGAQIQRAERDAMLLAQGVRPANPEQYYRERFGVQIDGNFYHKNSDEMPTTPELTANFAAEELNNRRNQAIKIINDIDETATGHAAEAWKELQAFALEQLDAAQNAEELEAIIDAVASAAGNTPMSEKLEALMVSGMAAGEVGKVD
jgi:phage gp29-like protein